MDVTAIQNDLATVRTTLTRILDKVQTVAMIQSDVAAIQTQLDNLEKIVVGTVPVPTPIPIPAPSGIKYHVWMYPGAPALDAQTTFVDNHVDVIRVEYFTLKPDGTLLLLKEDPKDLNSTKNAYSPANVNFIKKYSTEQLVTLSGDYLGLRGLANGNNLSTAVTTLTQFVASQGLTGIDVDIEGFGQFTTADYATYKSFLLKLGTALHNAGNKLSLCAPNWTSPFSSPPLSCGWKWQDFVALPIDYLTPMMYDWQWDYGAGTPVSPLSWIKEWCANMLPIFGKERLVIGLPSYGYSGTPGKYDINILTLDQIKAANGYVGGKRDVSSQEMMKLVGGKVYVSNDTTSMNAKLQVLKSAGVTQVSVWHAGGGNEFFTQ